MIKFSLEVQNLKKLFGRRLIFKELNFSLNQSQSLIIAGKNGSGKSTLIKIIAGVLSHSGGNIRYIKNGKEIDKEKIFNFIGLVSPYLVLYDEFTAKENLELFARIRGLKIEADLIDNLLNEIGLYDRRNDLLRTFSSGMKQRMKYASSILHNPLVLLIDEPTSNLDLPGKEFVQNLIRRYRKEKIVIVATNDREDYSFGDSVINLDDYK